MAGTLHTTYLNLNMFEQCMYTYWLLWNKAGVSILSKNQVFYKGGYESLEFFIRRHYVVFTKNKVVVYKKSAFFVRCVRFHDIQ